MNETKMIEVKNPPKTRDLDGYGFMEAGINGGDANSFINYVNSIYVGSLLDESIYVGKTQSQIENIKREIQDIKGAISRNDSDIESNKKAIDRIESKINDYRDKLNNYLSGGMNNGIVDDVLDTPSRIRTYISSFFLFMLSIFIFLFYVAVVHKALFVDLKDIANAMNGDSWGISLLPKWEEVQEAIRVNKMVVFAPFIFFGFGYAIHILLENKNKIKYLWIGLILIITFILDYLLAMQIHNKANDALKLIGDSPNNKFEDVLLVIIMGFVVYIIWSVIFHYWMGEIEKWNISSRLGNLIKQLNVEKDGLDLKLSAIEGEKKQNQSKINKLEESINANTIPLNAITKSISLFAQGWFKFLAGAKNDNLIQNCKLKLDDFISLKGLDTILKPL